MTKIDIYVPKELRKNRYFPNESHLHKAFYSKKIFKNLCEPDIEMGLLNSEPDPNFLVFSVNYNIEGKIEYAVLILYLPMTERYILQVIFLN
ncbi:MAG TPA: hypothetical protein VKY36_01440 [Moheibacter sp.]|nr:hypothetical protein [Moheibacter sp.]